MAQNISHILKINKALLVMFFVSFSATAFCQDFKTQFTELNQKHDTAAQRQLLNKWENVNNNDPELFIAYYNYYVTVAKTETLNMSTTQKGEKSIQFSDPKTGKVAGFINEGETFYDPTKLNKGFSYIDMGIQRFPDRLDMRFGKIYMLGQIKDYNKFAAEIIKTLDDGQYIGFKWKWAAAKPVDDPKKFMLSAMQDYITQLYEAGDEQLLNMRAVAAQILKYYAESVENLSNLAITYMLKKDYNTALYSLLKAEKLAPQDGIVLNNIAFCYLNKKDKPNAIKYYELATKYGDAQGKQFAQQKLKELKAN